MTKAAAGHHDRLIVKRIGQRGGDRRAVSTRAITDRVPERGRLLALDGPSVRTLHVNLDDAMKEDSDQDADLVRISGKSWSKFPEPTVCRSNVSPGGDSHPFQ